MAQPYVGEIRMFAGNFAPSGWMFCEGQLLPIAENDILFALIGTTYGGDGQSTFALPDLRGRLPIHQGQGSTLSNRILAETGGAEEITLATTQMPTHNHPFLGSNAVANDPNPKDNTVAESSAISLYSSAGPTAPMAPGAIGPVGDSQPHENRQPFLCVSFIISLFGIFPPPS
ncbi:MAG: phage tail protein [Betaproteobacteria bacterium]|nr:phage tail protein [Betaproteobacteria bacterium]